MRARRFIVKLPVSQEIPATHQMPGIKEMFQGGTWIFVLAIIAALVWTIHSDVHRVTDMAFRCHGTSAWAPWS